MKKMTLAFAIVILLCTSSHLTTAQDLIGNCIAITEDSPPLVSSSQNDHPACEESIHYAPDEAHLDRTPLITLKLNFHFFSNSNCQGGFRPDGNTCTNPAKDLNGKEVVESIVFFAEQQLQALDQNQIPGLNGQQAPKISDTRYRYEIYSAPNNPLDLYGGVFYHCDNAVFENFDDHDGGIGLANLKKNYSVYGEDVIDVFCVERLDGNNNYRPSDGVALVRGSAVLVSGVHSGYCSDRPLWRNAKLLNHEIAHNLNLRHTFDDTPCEDIDIVAECDEDNPCNDQVPVGMTGICKPRCSGSNNMLGYNGEQSALTPCQLGIMHYHLNVQRPGYIVEDFCELTDPEIVIESGEQVTWSSSRRLRSHLRIESGASLTLNCTLGMPTDGYIIIEPGGEMRIVDGTITNNCEGYWQGIRVKGNSTIEQDLNLQGYLRLTRATLEHAQKAVQLGNAYDLSVSGGVVRATFTTFRNNRRALEFIRYTTANSKSRLWGCDFIIDDEFQNQSFIAHATLWDINYVDFKTCRFLNQSGERMEEGIHSLGAGYSVQDCDFEGFDIGIRAESGHPFYGLSIQRSRFSDNTIGAKVVDYHAPWITANNFSVDNFAADFYPTVLGVHLLDCTGYVVEENVFVGQGLINTSIGLLVEDSGDEPNEVYRNNYENLGYGNLANGRNRDPIDEEQGLRYLCNQNSENRYDFAIPYEIDPDGAGIASIQQGKDNLSAGNRFSLQSTPTGSDFLNENKTLQYWHTNQNPMEIPVNYVLINPTSIEEQNSCESNLFPDEIPGDDDREVSIGRRRSYQQDYELAWQIYQERSSTYQDLQDTNADSNQLIITMIQMAQAANQYTFAANRLVQHFLTDSAGNQQDSVEYWLEQKDHLRATYAQMATLNPTQAVTAIQQVTQNQTLSSQQQIEYEDLRNFYHMKESWSANSWPLANLAGSEVATLQNLADRKSGKGSYKAQAILNFFYDFNYQHPPQLPEGAEQRQATKVEQLLAPGQEILLEVYPNPAWSWLTLNYHLPQAVGILILMNSQGEIIQKNPIQSHSGQVQFLVMDLPKGVYFFGWQHRGEILKIEKVLLQ